MDSFYDNLGDYLGDSYYALLDYWDLDCLLDYFLDLVDHLYWMIYYFLHLNNSISINNLLLDNLNLLYYWHLYPHFHNLLNNLRYLHNLLDSLDHRNWLLYDNLHNLWDHLDMILYLFGHHYLYISHEYFSNGVNCYQLRNIDCLGDYFLDEYLGGYWFLYDGLYWNYFLDYYLDLLDFGIWDMDYFLDNCRFLYFYNLLNNYLLFYYFWHLDNLLNNSLNNLWNSHKSLPLFLNNNHLLSLDIHISNNLNRNMNNFLNFLNFGYLYNFLYSGFSGD